MTTIKDDLESRIASREIEIAIIGLGYVGLPLAVAFAETGFTVIGIDVSAAKVESINQGKSYVEDIASGALMPLVTQGRLRASTDFAELADAGAIIICVPTPLRKTKDPDISYIVAATEEIARYGSSGKLIVLESTTYPGTTEEIILPRLARYGDEVGRDFFLAFSPERIDPGRSDYLVANTPKVVGGSTPNCLEIAIKLYGCIVQQPVPVSSTASAEMVKLLENTFRAVNIGLVNEVALMCNKLGLDVWEVVEAAATKPYGYMPFYPGPGLGGHCIPIDPHYLSWKLRTLNYTARFIELAAEVNSHMPDYVVNKVGEALNDHFKSVNGSSILVLGVAYKPNVSDTRESPALDVIHLLQQRGATVCYHDPLVSQLDGAGIPLQSIELTAGMLGDVDCAVVITNHHVFDWPWITKHVRLIVDTRNATKGLNDENIVYL